MDSDAFLRYIKSLQKNIEGFVFASLVYAEDGSLLEKSCDKNDNQLLSAFQSAIVNIAIDYVNKQYKENINVDEMVIAYQEHTHILLISNSKTIISHLIIENTANIKLARLVCSQYFKKEINNI